MAQLWEKRVRNQELKEDERSTLDSKSYFDKKHYFSDSTIHSSSSSPRRKRHKNDRLEGEFKKIKAPTFDRELDSIEKVEECCW